MKKIATKSYVESQVQNIRLDPNRLKNPNRQDQQDPRVRTFQQAFTTLNLPGFTALSNSDAILLNTIQMEIRKKLRSFGVQPGF
jgi:hypothetical protein